MNPKKGLSLAGFEKILSLVIDIDQITTEILKVNVIKPITAHPDSTCRPCDKTCGTSLLEKFSNDSETSGLVGNANVFISHYYSYKFINVVDTLRKWEKESPPTNGTNFYYFDLFTNNQHDADVIEFETLKNTFESSVRQIGKTLLLLTFEDLLGALKRSWIIFEVAVTLNSEIDMDIALAPTDDKKIEENLETFSLLANKMDNPSNDAANLNDVSCILQINVKDAKASKPEDKESIDLMITKHLGGFDAVDAKLRKILNKKYFIRCSRTIHNKKNSFTSAICLARFHRLAGEYNEAVTVLKDFLRDATTHKVVVEELDIANIQSYLGSLLRQVGETTEETVTLLRRALLTQEKYLDRLHDDILHTKSRLGVALKDLKHLDEAYEFYEEVYAIRSETKGPNDLDTIFSNMNRAMLFKVRKKFNEHDEIVKDVFSRRETVLGKSHQQTLFAKQMLGQIQLRRQNYEEAKKIFHDTLILQCDRMGEDHQEAISTRFLLALALSKLRDPLESLTKYKEALELAVKVRMKLSGGIGFVKDAESTANEVLKQGTGSEELQSLAKEVIDFFPRTGT